MASIRKLQNGSFQVSAYLGQKEFENVLEKKPMRKNSNWKLRTDFYIKIVMTKNL